MTNLDSLKNEIRLLNCLDGNGITTVGDALNKPLSEIAGIYNMGEKQLAILQKALADAVAECDNVSGINGGTVAYEPDKAYQDRMQVLKMAGKSA